MKATFERKYVQMFSRINQLRHHHRSNAFLKAWNPQTMLLLLTTILAFLVKHSLTWNIHSDRCCIDLNERRERRDHSFIQSSRSTISKPYAPLPWCRSSVKSSELCRGVVNSSIDTTYQSIDHGRRSALTNSTRCILIASTLLGGLTTPSKFASAAFFAIDHRQLELCLVAVLRVLYWAQRQVVLMDAAEGEDRQKALYLETRVGAKAVLTGRASGRGATSRVFTIATLQLPSCLSDLEWHASQSSDHRRKSEITDLILSFRESLASIVEFDGMDTLTDPSPRSALTMSQYDTKKFVLVQRTLKELVLPTGNHLVTAFGSEAYQQSMSFVQQYYSSETILDQ
jgi:hypothetical protein